MKNIISKVALHTEGHNNLVTFYPEKEEKLNILTHGIGFIAAIVGTYLLLSKTYDAVPAHFISYAIYCICLISVFAASTLYHSAKDVPLRRKLNIMDHAAIFLKIAGSYTPFMVITLGGLSGWAIGIAVWVFAFVGIILKLFYTGRYEKLSTFMYVVMGWMALLVIKPLIVALPLSALFMVLVGGIFYSIGALFFSINKIPYNHAIFHVFVLAGSLSHYLAIYFYV